MWEETDYLHVFGNMIVQARLAIPVVVVLAIFLGACRSKVDECNSLVEVINANRAGESNTADNKADVKVNADFDRNSVSSLSIQRFDVPEVKKLGGDLQAGFKGRLDAEEAMLDAADEDPPNVDKAKAALARVTAAGNAIEAAEKGVSNFCKE